MITQTCDIRLLTKDLKKTKEKFKVVTNMELKKFKQLIDTNPLNW